MDTRKRKGMGIFCVLLSVLLIVGGLSPQSVRAAEEEETEISEELAKAQESLADAQNEISQISEERESAQDRLENLESERTDLLSYIGELDQNLTEVQDTIDRLEAAMMEKQAEIDSAKEQLSQAQADAKEQYEAMKLRIQYLYENGNMQFLELLFSSGSLAELLNRSEYITALMEYDRDMLKEYQQTCQNIQDTQSILEEEYRQMEELQAVNEASREDLETLMEAKNEELSGYSDQIDNAEAQVDSLTDSLTQAMEEQEALIEQIEAEIRRQEEEAARREEEEQQTQESEEAQEGGETQEGETPSESEGSQEGGSGENGGNDSGSESGGSTGFIWPIPDSTRITSEFGEREAPIEGMSTFHKGLDVGVTTGTKIYAAAAGDVVISQYNYSAGNYIMINHGNGVYTVYMHCSKLLVSVGDHVEQGENIGLVGSTGYSTGPHLHFGVRVNGEYRNPLDYVSVP